MSEKELNDYRLTPMEESIDEMLSVIMKEAAAEASVQFPLWFYNNRICSIFSWCKSGFNRNCNRYFCP